jgi:predicted alpha/beta superfamily hydrolase
MNQIEIYNHLDGNNLCNLFANTIVEKLKENNPNVMVEISVINVRNFFIVRGKTDSDTVLNLTDVISKKLESLKPESSKLL